MNNLIKRHYYATSKRGFINPDTNMIEFTDKMMEEYGELKKAITNNLFGELSFQVISSDIAHEIVDLAAVCINMLTHYGLDFMEEYKKNVEYQERRI